MKKILIADDHVTVRAGLRAILEARAGWEVVAEACDGREAVAAAIETCPHVAILDQKMPLMNGLEATRCIKEILPATEVLLFTSHDSNELTLRAFEAGALAFVSKSESNKLLLAAVDSLMVHRPFFSGLYSSRSTSKRDPSQILSPRERDVVRMVAEGYSNKGISAMLDLSIKTTETHRAAAMRKLAVTSTAGLVRYAIRNNYLVA